MPRRKVCLLSPDEARNFELHNVQPNCREHLHISRKEALELAGSEYGPDRLTPPTNLNPNGTYRRRHAAQFLGKKQQYLLIEHFMYWRKKYTNMSEICGAPRFATLQLRP